MNNQRLTRYKWFWVWQDEKEEAWLEQMSLEGWHLESVQIPCQYTFRSGERLRYSYRLDYMIADQKKFLDYAQIFQDAGWEYLGEMTNWRYWRKLEINNEKNEIFTDTESKLKKYNRLLGVMSVVLFLLVYFGTTIFFKQSWFELDNAFWIKAIYLIGPILYAILIPVNLFVVIQLLRRINQLRKKRI